MSKRHEILVCGIAIVIISIIVFCVAKNYDATALTIISTSGVAVGLLISAISPFADD